MSEIKEKIYFNAKVSNEYSDGIVLSRTIVDQIIDIEEALENEIEKLKQRVINLQTRLNDYGVS